MKTLNTAYAELQTTLNGLQIYVKICKTFSLTILTKRY